MPANFDLTVVDPFAVNAVLLGAAENVRHCCLNWTAFAQFELAPTDEIHCKVSAADESSGASRSEISSISPFKDSSTSGDVFSCFAVYAEVRSHFEPPNPPFPLTFCTLLLEPLAPSFDGFGTDFGFTAGFVLVVTLGKKVASFLTESCRFSALNDPSPWCTETR
jgi:hypothetical protein